MIEMKFYRDDEYVYYNNPNGITKKMTIADFESMMSNESELPEYSSSSQGKVLSVDSDGDLEWADLPPAELPSYTSSDGGKVLTVNSGGTGVEWGAGGGGVMLVNVNSTETGMSLDKTWQEIYDAVDTGKCVMAIYELTDEITGYVIFNITGIFAGSDSEGDKFDVVTHTSTQTAPGTYSASYMVFTARSRNGYPLNAES